LPSSSFSTFSEFISLSVLCGVAHAMLPFCWSKFAVSVHCKRIILFEKLLFMHFLRELEFHSFFIEMVGFSELTAFSMNFICTQLAQRWLTFIWNAVCLQLRCWLTFAVLCFVLSFSIVHTHSDTSFITLFSRFSLTEFGPSSS
jgi:hypothetical protein